MAALAKDPADRPQSAAELKDMLHGNVPLQASAFAAAVTDQMHPSTFPSNASEQVQASAFAAAAAEPARTNAYSPSATEQVQPNAFSAGKTDRMQPNAFSSAATAPIAGAAKSTATGSSVQKWLPYIAVAAGCLIVLAIIFVNATSGGGGGGGGTVAAQTSTTTAASASASTAASASTSKAATETGSKCYLSTTADGFVALYIGQPGDGSSPVKISKVSASNLSSSTVADLAEGIEFDTEDEANDALKELREEANQAKAEREARENTSSTVTITVRGSDGKTRTEKIRRQGTTERVIPDSNRRKLSQSDIAGLTDAEKCIAWNEIIASSNGYAFKNSGLADYFGNCSWYHKDKDADPGGNLSSEASANVQLLQSHTDSWWLHLAGS